MHPFPLPRLPISHSLRLVSLGFLLLVVSTQSSLLRAQVLFSETLTGAQLAASSDVTLNPNAAFTVVGDALQIDPGSNDLILVRWNVLSASDRGALSVSITFDYTPISSDADPDILFADGTSVLGITRRDRNDTGGTALATWTTDGPNKRGTPEQADLATNLGDPQPTTFELYLADEGTASSLTSYTEGSFSLSSAYAYPSRFLDTDQALSFVFAAGGYNGSSELYQLNSVSVTVTAVPEPTTVATWIGLAGLMAAGAMRRRRWRAARS